MRIELLYRLYERRLAAGLRGGALPRHVGVVLDGNRRFAREKGLETVTEGHRIGAGKIHELVDWCHELGIPYVTLWLLSTDNLQRDAAEVSVLLDIIADTIRRMASEPRNVSRGLRITAVGALDAVPDELRRVLKEAEEATAAGTGLHVQVAVGYGGRQEITDALRALLEERHAEGATLGQVISELSPEAISAHLYTNGIPDPDLIIRTSGEIRLSGFMLWQSANSEFYFCDPYWPAFRKTDFLRALRDFASRQRRYGR
ncbi:MAG TPA: isoprenyl transferase [Egibacteraceae bacterium]|jgi:short-chain Z-isoprenyl diphosphate synthase|nr:isoprenyl transferase [Egibacteraceae bacterium]